MRLRAPLAALIFSLSAAVGVSAQTVVTPSNLQGWSGATYGSDYGSGAGFVGITTTYPRSGLGSVEIRVPSLQEDAIVWYLNFLQVGYSLNSVTTLAYDWLRASTSTTTGRLVPTFWLGLNDGAYLVYDYNYNALGVADAPEDSWVVSNILDGMFWFTGNGVGPCADLATSGEWGTLGHFNSSCYGNSAVVTSLNIYLYGWREGHTGSFYGAVDNIAFGADNFGPVIWDFEPDATTDVVPEPASMMLLATGLAGMAAARRKRARA